MDYKAIMQETIKRMHEEFAKEPEALREGDRVRCVRRYEHGPGCTFVEEMESQVGTTGTITMAAKGGYVRFKSDKAGEDQWAWDPSCFERIYE